MSARSTYISLTAFAEDLGVSDRTVRRWIAQGRLKAIRPSERVIRIHRDEAARFIAANAA